MLYNINILCNNIFMKLLYAICKICILLYILWNNQIANLCSRNLPKIVLSPPPPLLHPFFVDHIAYLLADKYAGHEAMFRKRHLLLNRMLSVILCRGTLPYYRSLSSQPPFSSCNISCSSLLTHRTWYMKHIALPSDGMTLTQPPSREIMPHDPVTPDHNVMFLPFRM